MDYMISVCTLMLLYCSLGNAEVCNVSATPPDPKSGCCGRAVGVDKSIPGLYAQLSEYPWMGIIEYEKENTTKLLCSAILISGRYMLSAAQCFGTHAQLSGKPTNVRLGEYNANNDGPDCEDVGGYQNCNDGAVKVPIEKVITHPDYNRNSYEHDIALIRLAEMAPKSDFIQPICLPTSDVTIASAQLRMRVAGWGAINNASAAASYRLHHVDLPYVDLDTCQSAFNVSKTRQVKLGNGQLCAGGEEGKDSCKGDSGGPLMYVRDNTTTEVAGIVSFGTVPCGRKGVPGVYTKVFAYDAWIRANIED